MAGSANAHPDPPPASTEPADYRHALSDSPERAPGGGSFTLDGRPAGGLYLAAWLLSLLGLGLLLIGTQTRPPLIGFLVVAALLLLTAGLATAAGYQLIARATRPAQAYRGPSPLILFGLQLALVNGLGLVLLGFGMSDPRAGATDFLIAAAAILAAYVLTVWLFVVRPGVLGLRELGLPVGWPINRALADAAMGAGSMLLVWPLITTLAGLLARLLGTRTAEVVPPAATLPDLLLTILAAAILVPIGEELFFRGFALTAWLRDLGPRTALIRSTLFFAVAHVLTITATTFEAGARQAVLTVAIIVPLGAALGWLFLRRGLIASTAGHATFNLISVVAISVAQQVTPPT